jgi:hypothetical protein
VSPTSSSQQRHTGLGRLTALPLPINFCQYLRSKSKPPCMVSCVSCWLGVRGLLGMEAAPQRTRGRVRAIAAALCAATPKEPQQRRSWADLGPGVHRYHHPLIPDPDGGLDAPQAIAGFSREVPAGSRSLPVVAMVGSRPGAHAAHRRWGARRRVTRAWSPSTPSRTRWTCHSSPAPSRRSSAARGKHNLAERPPARATRGEKMGPVASAVEQ